MSRERDGSRPLLSTAVQWRVNLPGEKNNFPKVPSPVKNLTKFHTWATVVMHSPS